MRVHVAPSGPPSTSQQPAVLGSEVVDQLEHERVVGAVRAGAERGGDVEDAHPEVVAQLPHAHPTVIGEPPPQGIVDRSVDGLDRADQVDAEQVVPHRRLGVGVDGLELEDAQDVGGDAVGPVVVEHVAGERVGHLVGTLVDRGEEARATRPWREERRPPLARDA